MHNRFTPGGGADTRISAGGDADRCAVHAGYASGTACR